MGLNISHKNGTSDGLTILTFNLELLFIIEYQLKGEILQKKQKFFFLTKTSALLERTTQLYRTLKYLKFTIYIG